jgi:hypothetical protein
MPRPIYVYGYENEPADERPTDFGQTNFGHTNFGTTNFGTTNFDLSSMALSTQPAPWIVSEHSTFDAPSRAFERVQALQQRSRRLRWGLTALALVLLAGIAAAVAHTMQLFGR